MCAEEVLALEAVVFVEARVLVNAAMVESEVGSQWRPWILKRVPDLVNALTAESEACW